MLKIFLRSIAISIKDKKAIIRETAFFQPLKYTLKDPKIPIGIAHLTITKKQVSNTFLAQFAQKVPGPDKINFGIYI